MPSCFTNFGNRAPSARCYDQDYRARERFMIVHRVLSLLICLTVPCLEARADEIRGLVTIGMQRVFDEVKPAFEMAARRRLEVQFASSPDIAKLVQEGEVVDFIIVSG